MQTSRAMFTVYLLFVSTFLNDRLRGGAGSHVILPGRATAVRCEFSLSSTNFFTVADGNVETTTSNGCSLLKFFFLLVTEELTTNPRDDEEHVTC